MAAEVHERRHRAPVGVGAAVVPDVVNVIRTARVRACITISAIWPAEAVLPIWPVASSEELNQEEENDRDPDQGWRDEA